VIFGCIKVCQFPILIKQLIEFRDSLQFLQIRKATQRGWEHTRQLIVLKMTAKEKEVAVNFIKLKNMNHG
jgi:hypothetical protein